jgi:hypothetical protein
MVGVMMGDDGRLSILLQLDEEQTIELDPETADAMGRALRGAAGLVRTIIRSANAVES